MYHGRVQVAKPLLRKIKITFCFSVQKYGKVLINCYSLPYRLLLEGIPQEMRDATFKLLKRYHELHSCRFLLYGFFIIMHEEKPVYIKFLISQFISALDSMSIGFARTAFISLVISRDRETFGIQPP